MAGVEVEAADAGEDDRDVLVEVHVMGDTPSRTSATTAHKCFEIFMGPDHDPGRFQVRCW